ncbi:MAG: ShlB/FhaC/HecB family hemolysin secretion/activation protein [Symploca sp. SIO2C1]|nr:ShlB/FhaC/HecB family hemolysin secretion/activation protein [Symploca sp. SIO2C1]
MATVTSLLCLNYNSVALAQLNSQLTNELASNDSELVVEQSSQKTDTPVYLPSADAQFSQSLLLQSKVKQLAQTPPDIPSGILEPTRPDLPPLPTTPPETPTPILPTPETPETPETPDSELGVKVKVERVEILGSNVFSPAELEAAVAEFIGREATFEELLEIRTIIAQLYTDNGYTTSGAFLPPQDLTDGVVIVQVVEGAIEQIEIEGLERLHEGYVRSRLGLAAQPPINLQRLEEALQLLQLNPLLDSVQAELSAGTAPGLSVLTLNLREASPWVAEVSLDNHNSPSIGSLGGTVALAHNNLLGFGDRLSAEYSLTTGLDNYDLSYEIPLNPRDGSLNVSYTNSYSQIVEEPFSQFDINSRSYTLSVGFRQPFIRTPTKELALGLSFDLRQSQTFLLEDIPFSFSLGPDDGKSRVSVLRFSQDWINREPSRVLAARSQLSFGLDIFDPTINDTSVDGLFTSWLGQFQWVQALGTDTILIGRIGAQFSLDPLLPLEQFSIGGVDTVRGYRQNQQVADNGIAASLELRYPLIRNSDGIGTLQLTPFFDVGRVWNNDRETSVSIGTSSSATLASIGLGLRWQIDSSFSARLDWGIPLLSIDNEGNSLQDNGVSFSLRYQPF